MFLIVLQGVLQRLFQCRRQALPRIFSSLAYILRPFKVDFGLNRKTSAGAASGCCGMTLVLIFVREFQIDNDECAGTLLRCSIHRFAFYDSGLFFFMDSRKRLKTYK
jgi:hypothetical protein